MASRRRVAAGTRWRATSTANATGRWRPTCAGTAPRARGGRSTWTDACATSPASPPAASRSRATRWAGGSRCTSRSRTPSGCRSSCSISTTAGIEDAAERAARRAHDEELAAWIEQHTIAEFADRWGAHPLFAGQSAGGRRGGARRPPVQRPRAPRRRAARDRHRRDGAAVGAPRRARRCRPPSSRASATSSSSALARRLAGGLPAATLRIVPDAGHALALEAPAAVAAAIAAV